jgi:hypothetical protein
MALHTNMVLITSFQCSNESPRHPVEAVVVEQERRLHQLHIRLGIAALHVRVHFPHHHKTPEDPRRRNRVRRHLVEHCTRPLAKERHAVVLVLVVVRRTFFLFVVGVFVVVVVVVVDHSLTQATHL